MADGFILCPLFQQDHGEHLGEEGQQIDLILCPEAFVLTVIEPNIAAEYAIVADGTVQYGFDALGLQDISEVAGQSGNIGNIEYILFIKVFQEGGDVVFVADHLQVIDLRFYAFVAPFEGVVAVFVVRCVFKNINTADIQLLADQRQHVLQGGFYIAGFIQTAEGILHDIAVDKFGMLIGVDLFIDSGNGFLAGKGTDILAVIEQEVILAMVLHLVQSLIGALEQFVVSSAMFRRDGNTNGAANVTVRQLGAEHGLQGIKKTLAALFY